MTSPTKRVNVNTSLEARDNKIRFVKTSTEKQYEANCIVSSGNIDSRDTMLLAYLHNTSNVTDRCASGETPGAIEEKLKEIDNLIKRLGPEYTTNDMRGKL